MAIDFVPVLFRVDARPEPRAERHATLPIWCVSRSQWQSKIAFDRSKADVFFQHSTNETLLILRLTGLSPMRPLRFQSSCLQMKRDQAEIGKQVGISSIHEGA